MFFKANHSCSGNWVYAALQEGLVRRRLNSWTEGCPTSIVDINGGEVHRGGIVFSNMSIRITGSMEIIPKLTLRIPSNHQRENIIPAREGQHELL